MVLNIETDADSLKWTLFQSSKKFLTFAGLFSVEEAGTGWVTNTTRAEEKCLEVVRLSGDLMEAVGRVEPGAQHLQLSSSIRLSVASASKVLQQGQTNIKTGEISENIQTHLEPLLSSLASLTDRIAKLREG